MHGGPSGFSNAPVTRMIVIASGLLSAIFGIRRRALSLGLSYHENFRNLKLWRIIASELAFVSTPELMFGLYLLYYFRVFERQIGSNKYSVFVMFSILTSLLFEVLALVLLKDPTGSLASGPYGLIFASFVPFFLDIPVSSRFHIIGISLTDKSFIYLAGLQLLLSSWRRSLVPGICGILAGILYRINAFGIRGIKFPEFISSSFAWLTWSSGSSSRTSPSGNVIRNLPSNPGRNIERNHPSASRSSVPEPSEDSIATLVAMGFDSNSARQALVRARNDINVATSILLES